MNKCISPLRGVTDLLVLSQVPLCEPVLLHSSMHCINHSGDNFVTTQERVARGRGGGFSV